MSVSCLLKQAQPREPRHTCRRKTLWDEKEWTKETIPVEKADLVVVVDSPGTKVKEGLAMR